MKVAIVDDDRDDPETGDQSGVDAAEGYAERAREQEAENPVAAADGVQRQRGEVLGDRRADGEGDVDAAGDQHHQQPDGPR